MMTGSWERLVLEQSKLSACPPNQIMDLLLIVDTTSDFDSPPNYQPLETNKILNYLIGSYNIDAWDTHIGIASFDGKSLKSEILPNQFGKTADDGNSTAAFLEYLATYLPTSDQPDDPNLKSLRASKVPLDQIKPLSYDMTKRWLDSDPDLEGTFRDGIRKVQLNLVYIAYKRFSGVGVAMCYV
jgi:hypothetical protein